MIPSAKIDEWVKEVEERSWSAPVIVRFIANRLSDLSQRNEELTAENLALRTERKVEEYEKKIAELEYQLDLLKRQIEYQPAAEHATVSLLIYNSQGQVLRSEIAAEQLEHNQLIDRLALGPPDAGKLIRLLCVNNMEELLCVFDTGRVTTLPVTAIPSAPQGALSWKTAASVNPSGPEELVAILPVARMALYDYSVQISRRAYVRRITRQFFKNYLANRNIGSGVRLQNDKCFSAVLCNRQDLLVLVSKSGHIASFPVETLPVTLEAILKLGTFDHIVSAFTAAPESEIAVVTQDGKAIQRPAEWKNLAGSFKTQGKPLITRTKNEASNAIAGVFAAETSQWIALLENDGALRVCRLAEMVSKKPPSGAPVLLAVAPLTDLANRVKP